ncbi:hypothetical protein DKX38_017981 [Salix brachista]|uniref:CCHC-type domain-containing protein n=1 Tax=Salix brachista TaxID=2182728 RepID=A0A5N5KWP2_9ROSI|nr:hypothetical protein DKX38_017981 [Salix brachista]
MQTIYSLTEAINLATKVETQLERSKATTVMRNSFDHTNNAAAKGKLPMSSPPPTHTTRGNNNYNRPPTTGTAPETSRNPYARPSSDKCYRCGQPGHRSNQCPKRGAINLVDNEGEADLETEELDEDTAFTYDADEVTGGDEGELLSHAMVVRKILLAPKQVVKTQRHNIFRTRCTVNRKVCDVIIDNGSTENIVSKTMVKKLGLKTEKHPTPYSIGWIRKGTETRITEIYRIQFSIGKNYADEIVCDVVEMDACHMIFGRPWQYDVDVTYRGRDNVYIFMKEGQKIVLGPITEEFTKSIEPQTTEGSFLLIEGKNFIEATKEAQEIFAVVVGEQASTESPRHLEEETTDGTNVSTQT